MSKYAIALLALLAILGLSAILFASAPGIGISPDSAVYMASARSLLEGEGLTIPTGIDDPVPMTHYAPLYPALLALLGSSGVDLVIAVKWLNALLFSSTVFLTGFIVLQTPGRSILPALLASLFILVLEDMLIIYSFAWSEPLFIFLSILGLFLFAHYLWRPAPQKLLGWLVLLSMAFLTRYAGVAVLPVIFLGILLFQQDQFPKRFLRATGLSVACALPTLIWFARNFSITNDISDRGLFYHPMTSKDLRNGMDTLSGWIIPGRITGTIRDVLIVMILLAVIILIIAAIFKGARRAKHDEEQELGQIIPAIFALFCLSYSLVLVFTILFMDAQTSFDYRLLSPLLVSGIIVIFSTLPIHLRKVSWPILASIGVVFLLVITFNAVHAAKFITKSNEGSFKMFGGKGWQEAEIIYQLETIPTGLPIYSNGDDAIYYVTGIPAARLPLISNPFTLQENASYQLELDQMRDVLEHRGGVIVCFAGITWRGYLPSCDELESLFPLSRLWVGDEGIFLTFE